VSGDGNHPNLNHPTLVDLIETAGKSWKAVAEGASGSGCGLNPPRGEDHFPFLSYTTITGNSARCANLIGGDSNTVISQFNAGTLPPPLSVDFSYAPAQPAITQTVTFTATPNSGTGPYTFAWNFGDGATGNGNPATHVYTTPNTYTVGVTTTDSAGASAVKSKPVVVLAAPPPGPV